MKALRFLAVNVALLLASSALLAKPGPLTVVRYAVTVSGAAFTDLAINTSKTTDAIYVEGFRYAKFEMSLTRVAANNVTMTCQESDNGTSGWKDIPILTPSSGTSTSVPHTWSNAVAGNEAWPWTVNVTMRPYIRCSFIGASAGVSDLLTVTLKVGL